MATRFLSLKQFVSLLDRPVAGRFGLLAPFGEAAYKDVALPAEFGHGSQAVSFG